MENLYEVFFTETVRSKVYIKAESIEEVKEKFEDVRYSLNDVHDLEAFNTEIEEIQEVK